MYNTKDLKEALTKAKKRLREMHPELTELQLAHIVTQEYYKRTGESMLHYSQAVHFHLVDRGMNVACLNGSAHVRLTRDEKEVTCAICIAAMQP